jgi:hypothetical protein
MIYKILRLFITNLCLNIQTWNFKMKIKSLKNEWTKIGDHNNDINNFL